MPGVLKGQQGQLVSFKAALCRFRRSVSQSRAAPASAQPSPEVAPLERASPLSTNRAIPRPEPIYMRFHTTLQNSN
ncbi:protein of unknown function [Pararobbsia alpina]